MEAAGTTAAATAAAAAAAAFSALLRSLVIFAAAAEAFFFNSFSKIASGVSSASSLAFFRASLISSANINAITCFADFPSFKPNAILLSLFIVVISVNNIQNNKRDYLIMNGKMLPYLHYSSSLLL
jgi:hypothetical protein